MTCSQNQLFDPIEGCRDIVCPEGFTASTGTCMPIVVPTEPTITTDHRSGDNSSEPTNNTTGSTPYSPTESINCTTIALDPEEYEDLGNSSVLFRGEVTLIVGYDATGRPLVCVNFNRTGMVVTSNNFTFVSYPAGFTELTYIGSSLSIIASILILITYSIFKELRTLPSKLLMNVAVAFLFGDVFLIVSGIISRNHLPAQVCTLISIMLHYFFLSRFSWMNVLGIEYVRTFILAIKLRIGKSKTSVLSLIAYTLFGWGVPLVITTTTVIVNYTVDDAVRYGTSKNGTNALCWINEIFGAIFGFVLPIMICMLFNIAFFVIVLILLCSASRRSTKELKQHRLVQIRVMLGVFAVLGINWVFGFLAILVDLSWAWYPFIILNSNQAVLIAIGFLGTKRILKLYYSLFKCKELMKSKVYSDKSKSTKMIEMEELDIVDKSIHAARDSS